MFIYVAAANNICIQLAIHLNIFSITSYSVVTCILLMCDCLDKHHHVCIFYMALHKYLRIFLPASIFLKLLSESFGNDCWKCCAITCTDKC